MWALGIGMGLTTIVLSLRYRMPVLTAWSTPGAALLITSVSGVPMAEIIGAFVLTGLATVAIGLSGAFDRLMKRLPTALAAAMLAGVLLRFGLEAFGAMKTQFALVCSRCSSSTSSGGAHGRASPCRARLPPAQRLQALWDSSQRSTGRPA
jgi:benzoate membrane transport protein